MISKRQYMRRLIPPLLCCCLLLQSSRIVHAAPSPPAESQGDTPATLEAEDSLQLPADDEPDSAANNEADSDHGQAETSWERLNAERQEEQGTPPAEEPPNTFSPLVIWRMLRNALWDDK
jgi:hypothetical protein